MKKLIIVLAIIVTILSINKNEDKIIIPKDSIRFRIIANSDTIDDQNLKKLSFLIFPQLLHNLII